MIFFSPPQQKILYETLTSLHSLPHLQHVDASLIPPWKYLYTSWHSFLQETCVLSWDVGTVTGFYGAAINVEDFISSTSTIPLSSIPLQFLLDVFSSPQMCTEGSRPTLVPGETPEDGSCIAVPFGSTYSALLVADSGGADVRWVQG